MTPFDDPVAGFDRSALVWGDESGMAPHALRLPSHCALDQAPSAAAVLIAPAYLLSGLMHTSWLPAEALVVLTGPRAGYLRPEDCDRLWRLFGVPVFERLCDGDWVVVAAECEAHDGLHLLEGVPPAAGVLEHSGASVAQVAHWGEENCGCGVKGMKLRGIGPLAVSRAA